MRGLALQVKKDLGLRFSYETIRNVFEKHKYSLRLAREQPLLSAQNIGKRLRFAIDHVSLSPEYWYDLVYYYFFICDENNALKNKNLIPAVKFGKPFVMVWGCISSKGVGVVRFLNKILIREVYLDI